MKSKVRAPRSHSNTGSLETIPVKQPGTNKILSPEGSFLHFCTFFSVFFSLSFHPQLAKVNVSNLSSSVVRHLDRTS